MRPRYPLYIPSKGRATSCLTPGALDRMGVDYRIVIEESQRDDYAAHHRADRLLVLDPSYQRDYETCDDLGDSKSKGPGPARNFIWEHSIAEGHRWHWVMDDNIALFARLHRNRRIPLGDGTGFHAMETFVDRYENVAMAGPHYWMFAPSRGRLPPYETGTRIYSCNLIRNDVPYRWRGRYNEDTILSIDMLKDGWLTVQFFAFLQYKVTTQTIGGGNTAEFYAIEGTAPKSEMLVRVHPDVATLAVRWGRVHHYVDYRRHFGHLRLVRRPGVEIPEANPYRLRLVDRPDPGPLPDA